MASSSGPDDAAPHAKRIRIEEGGKWAWPTRYSEFHRRFAELRPTGVIDAKFSDPTTWPDLIQKGSESLISGSCSQCKAKFESSINYLLRPEYSLPQCKCTRAGKQQPWTSRRDEFVQRLAEKNGELDAHIVESNDAWAKHITEHDLKVDGKCMVCSERFSNSRINDLMKKGLKLPGCKCKNTASQRNPESYRRESQCWSNKKAEFFEKMSELRPHLSIDGAEDNDAAWAERLKDAGGKTPLNVTCTSCSKKATVTLYVLLDTKRKAACNCGRVDGRRNAHSGANARTGVPGSSSGQSQQAVIAMVESKHPNIVLDADMMDPDKWAEWRPGCFFLLRGRCTECGNRVSGTINNVKKQNFGGCECADRAKALATAQACIGETHDIFCIYPKRYNNQNHYVVKTKCRKCSWVTEVQTRKNNTRPSCLCTGNASWKSEQGYDAFLDLLENNHKLKGVIADFDADWWLNNVQNHKSTVPFKCTLCGVEKEVAITSIQQGNGMGCSCNRSADLFKGELEKLLVDSNICQEWVIGKNVQSGRNLLVDFVAKLPDSSGPWVLFELDGPKHFTGVRDGRHCAATAERDFNKEILAGERGIPLIRIYQAWVWEDIQGWREYLKNAIEFVVANPGGRIITPDIPEYTSSGLYAARHSDDERLLLSETAPFDGACEWCFLSPGA